MQNVDEHTVIPLVEPEFALLSYDDVLKASNLSMVVAQNSLCDVIAL